MELLNEVGLVESIIRTEIFERAEIDLGIECENMYWLEINTIGEDILLDIDVTLDDDEGIDSSRVILTQEEFILIFNAIAENK